MNGELIICNGTVEVLNIFPQQQVIGLVIQCNKDTFDSPDRQQFIQRVIHTACTYLCNEGFISNREKWVVGTSVVVKP